MNLKTEQHYSDLPPGSQRIVS